MKLKQRRKVKFRVWSKTDGYRWVDAKVITRPAFKVLLPNGDIWECTIANYGRQWK